ncbi:hypothetical protein D3C73_890300 [compost metagenome]
MLRRTPINTDRLAFEAQLAGVASGARNIQKLIFAAGVLMPRKAYRQVARVVRRGFLVRIDQEPETCQVLRRGEALFGKRQLQRSEPLITQAFDLSALGREIVGLAVARAPLLQVMHLLRR